MAGTNRSDPVDDLSSLANRGQCEERSRLLSDSAVLEARRALTWVAVTGR